VEVTVEITLKVANEVDAAQAIAALSALYPTTPVLRPSAKDKLFAERKPIEPEKPTPLEVAIEEKKAAQDAPDERPGAEMDPFKQLLDNTPTAAELGNPQQKLAEEPKAEKKPRKNAKKETAPEPEKVEDKPLTLDDIRKASTVALELVGAPTIQEALAKFNAVDDKNVLRMSALREADYALYVEYLKKKVNDAAKEWPANG
jgi:hypothetical protein